MSEHVTSWLGAYHDGELHGTRLRQVENHLAGCAECLAELEAMQGLSALLQEMPPAGDFISTERFVANLTLNLPRQSEAPQPRKWLEIGWWLLPVGVLGAWVFLQVTFSLSGLLQSAVETGLLGGSLAWLRGNPPQMEWFALARNLLGSQPGFIGPILSALNDASLFLQHLAGQFFWQAILAALYLGWLAAWWFRQPDPRFSSQ
jgi:hypothetical protein